MVLFNSSTWLLVVVFVNVVSPATIDETEDSVKTSFIKLLKNIVNINEKRIDAMKQIEEEKDFRLGGYLSTIHEVNDDSQEYETNRNPYLRIIDMRRNLNLSFRETYTQAMAMFENEAKMFLPFERFNFKTLKINNKKKALQSNDQIIELPSGYKSEPSILDVNNRIFQKDTDIVELPKKYHSKSSIDGIKATLFSSDDNYEKKKKTIFQKDDNTIKLLREYLSRDSIEDLVIKFIKLNESYQKKKNELRQKKDIIRKLQDKLNIFKKTHMVKDQNENILRNIVNHNETEEDTKFEDHSKKKPDHSKKKPDNVDLVFTFDDGKEGEESQWTDWSYEFAEGEAFSSWENKGDRQNTRKSWSGCGKSAAKSCSDACSIAHKKHCTRYKCTRKAEKAFKKECDKTCKAEFIPSKYSEERL